MDDPIAMMELMSVCLAGSLILYVFSKFFLKDSEGGM